MPVATFRPASDGRRELTVALWTPGAVAAADAPVLVSITDLELSRGRDVAGAYWEGLRLRRLWGSVPGSLGLWLWGKPRRRRGGSISVWRDEDALRGFVGWERHVEVMRRYRGAGELTAATWQAERFDPAEIWARAWPRLAGDDPELSHSPVPA
jgi:hypothetical protein